MTKEEYERLLKSDYWKGYSYSLIKERNFTCEDCGRSFYNERNKLQVHHLVYRDVNPWSYRPEEVIVLCEECHKKRHGIPTESAENTSYSQKPWGDYNKNYSSTTETKAETVFSSRTLNNNRDPYPIEPERPHGFQFKYVIYGILLFLFVMIGRDLLFKHSSENNIETTDEQKELVIDNNQTTPSSPIEERKSETYRQTSSKKEVRQNDNIISTPSADENLRLANEEPTSVASTAQVESPKAEHIDEPSHKEADRELSTSEILERRTHANVVKQAQRAGVSTEGTTSEILDRMTHANVVKQAQRAGVSTEGTTSEILDRITHANVVKQAQRAGVSTEGTTSEILERITHANVVKQAQRAGVSTEGTTSEILERITKKNLERYNY